MMLRVEDGPRVFNVRAVAVFLHEGKVLLQRAPGDAFLALPGGRVEWGETFAETVQREMREELHEGVTVGRMLWFVENFFELGGKRMHELDVYVEARLPDGSPLLRSPGPHPSAEAPGITLEWRDVTRLGEADLPLKPGFLVRALRDPPPTLAHVVER